MKLKNLISVMCPDDVINIDDAEDGKTLWNGKVEDTPYKYLNYNVLCIYLNGGYIVTERK